MIEHAGYITSAEVSSLFTLSAPVQNHKSIGTARTTTEHTDWGSTPTIYERTTSRITLLWDPAIVCDNSSLLPPPSPPPPVTPPAPLPPYQIHFGVVALLGHLGDPREHAQRYITAAIPLVLINCNPADFAALTEKNLERQPVPSMTPEAVVRRWAAGYQPRHSSSQLRNMVSDLPPNGYRIRAIRRALLGLQNDAQTSGTIVGGGGSMTLRLQDLLEGPRTPLHRSGLNNTASKGRGVEGVDGQLRVKGIMSITTPSASRWHAPKFEEESKKKETDRAVDFGPPPKITRDDHEARLVEVREIYFQQQNTHMIESMRTPL